MAEQCPNCSAPEVAASTPRTLDRLAAKRARHVSEFRASLESDGKARREAVRHASDWDVDDDTLDDLYPGSGAVSAAWLYRFPPMQAEESA